MAITTAITTTSSVSWLVTDIPDTTDSNKFFKDEGQLLFSKNFNDGTGSLGGINHKWNDTFVITSGEDVNLNLTALNTMLFNEIITTSFTGIKAWYFRNDSTGVSNRISVLATGDAAANAIFDGGSGNFIIHPNSVAQNVSWVSGWNLSANNKNLIIRDVGGLGSQISVFFCGVSGV